ncbi:MAG: IclR family transcriptional regulator [Methylobacteriaceae bacterium]|nr:IclR family transcriptional regulator [Methylobacteriaceae bacterium]
MRAVGASEEGGATLSQITANVGLNIATTRRLLQAMAAEGLILFNTDKKTYQIGPALIALAASGDSIFASRDIFLAAAREVAERTSDTTFLMIRRSDTAICIGRVEGAFPIRVMALDVGSLRPLGAGSGSLALLAFLAPDECNSIIRRNAAEYRKYKLSAETVSEMAKEARTVGTTFNPGLIIDGVFGVGVPVYRGNSVVASISVTAIAQRLGERRRAEVVTIIRNAIGRLKSFSTAPIDT